MWNCFRFSIIVHSSIQHRTISSSTSSCCFCCFDRIRAEHKGINAKWIKSSYCEEIATNMFSLKMKWKRLDNKKKLQLEFAGPSNQPIGQQTLRHCQAKPAKTTKFLRNSLRLIFKFHLRMVTLTICMYIVWTGLAAPSTTCAHLGQSVVTYIRFYNQHTSIRAVEQELSLRRGLCTADQAKNKSAIGEWSLKSWINSSKYFNYSLLRIIMCCQQNLSKHSAEISFIFSQ